MSTSARQLQLEFPLTPAPAQSPDTGERARTSSGPAPAFGRVAEPVVDVATPGPIGPLHDRAELFARAESLARHLSAELGMPVRLAVTDNRSTMVSFRRASSSLRLRLHHMFLDAPAPVVRAIADYAGRGRRSAGPVLDEYIRVQQPRIRKVRDARSGHLVARGVHYDLREMFDALNERYFQGGIQATIGWGRWSSRRRRKSIRLGVYDHQTREIRIHPALDKAEVPRFFVEFIVFHEMLHQLFPSSNVPGRRVHHPRAFRDREKAFPHYEAAIAWEKANLRTLLRS